MWVLRATSASSRATQQTHAHLECSRELPVLERGWEHVSDGRMLGGLQQLLQAVVPGEGEGGETRGRAWALQCTGQAGENTGHRGGGGGLGSGQGWGLEGTSHTWGPSGPGKGGLGDSRRRGSRLLKVHAAWGEVQRGPERQDSHTGGPEEGTRAVSGELHGAGATQGSGAAGNPELEGQGQGCDQNLGTRAASGGG